MRKILDQNFWSHGTPLGSLGPLSQQDTILGAGQLQILVIWGPYRPPIVVALETQAENPKTAGLQCDKQTTSPPCQPIGKPKTLSMSPLSVFLPFSPV